MLPKFPTIDAWLKKSMVKTMMNLMRQHEGILGQVGKSIIHEGNKRVLIREDGSVEPLVKRRISTNIEMPLDELNAIKPELVYSKINEAAKYLAGQQAQHLFQTIDDACQTVGNVIDANGKPISSSLILEMMKKINIDFNNDGSPRIPTIVVAPEAKERLIIALQDFKNNPYMKKCYDDLIEIKREEWRDRESDRKLVG